MPFVRKAGITGLIWEPHRHGKKKHPCRDCFQCAWCGDERCESCVSGKREREKDEEGKREEKKKKSGSP